MTRLPLRWVLLLPVLAIITIGFGAFGAYIDRVEHANRIADIDEELVRAGVAADTRLRPGDRPARPAGGAETPTATGIDPPVEVLVSADGRVLAAAGTSSPLPDGTLADLVQGEGARTLDGLNLRTATDVNDDGTVTIVGLSLGPADAARAELRRNLALGGAVILLAVGAVIWFLTARLTRPLAAMTAASHRIAAGELDTDVGTAGGSREISDLSTDLNRMLARLRTTIADSERSARTADQARDDMQRFLADMSHELRTPLTALKGYSDLYAGGMLELSSDVDRAMARIGSESERLYRLASDMLQLAREEQPDDMVETVDLGDVAVEVVNDLRAAHPERPIECTVDRSVTYLVHGSPGRLHQALLNLGANACQHSAANEVVRIDVRHDGDAVAVDVVDRGRGVPSDQREQIFLPFYRAEPSRTRTSHGGAGLGLALVTQISEQHGGTVAVGPTPGGGATFTLTLPRARPHP